MNISILRRRQNSLSYFMDRQATPQKSRRQKSSSNRGIKQQKQPNHRPTSASSSTSNANASLNPPQRMNIPTPTINILRAPPPSPIVSTTIFSPDQRRQQQRHLQSHQRLYEPNSQSSSASPSSFPASPPGPMLHAGSGSSSHGSSSAVHVTLNKMLWSSSTAASSSDPSPRTKGRVPKNKSDLAPQSSHLRCWKLISAQMQAWLLYNVWIITNANTRE